MFKLTCVLLSIAVLASATDYRIAGTSLTTAPYTKMTLASTTTSGKVYSVTFTHVLDTLATSEGSRSFCCATAVSDSTKSASIKDKCVIYQVRCGGADCATAANSNLSQQVNSGTYASTGITLGATWTSPTTAASTATAKTALVGYTLTEAEAMAAGLPHTMSPSYKVDIKCWYETKKTSYAAFDAASAAVLTAALPSSTLTFTIGSGAFSTILSVGVFSVVSALALF